VWLNHAQSCSTKSQPVHKNSAKKHANRTKEKADQALTLNNSDLPGRRGATKHYLKKLREVEERFGKFKAQYTLFKEGWSEFNKSVEEAYSKVEKILEISVEKDLDLAKEAKQKADTILSTLQPQEQKKDSPGNKKTNKNGDCCVIL